MTAGHKVAIHQYM